MLKKTYYKLLSKINKITVSVNSFEFKDFEIQINSDILEFQPPEMLKVNETYVLIRNLKFHPEIKLNELEQFKNQIKLKFLNLDFIVVFRNYPIKLTSKLIKLAKEQIILKLPEKINEFKEKQINIAKSIKVTEELLQILPYTRKKEKQKLFRLPITRSPLYKSYFPDSEIKRFREELALQNKTRWSNVEILEIYDKFNVKIFSDIRQTSGSRNLLCYPSFSNADFKINDDLYFLIIGKRRDTGELVKALSKPAIKEDDYKS